MDMWGGDREWNRVRLELFRYWTSKDVLESLIDTMEDNILEMMVINSILSQSMYSAGRSFWLSEGSVVCMDDFRLLLALACCVYELRLDWDFRFSWR